LPENDKSFSACLPAVKLLNFSTINFLALHQQKLHSRVADLTKKIMANFKIEILARETFER
jgi:hypothetical protein